jgi:hypothetical protein
MILQGFVTFCLLNHNPLLHIFEAVFFFKLFFIDFFISLKAHMSYSSRSTSPSVLAFSSSYESIISFSSSIFVLISIKIFSSLSLLELLSLLS